MAALPAASSLVPSFAPSAGGRGR